MKLRLTTLYVNDFEESLKFYHETLKLPVIRVFENGAGARLAMLGEEDSAHLELICDNGKTADPGRGMSLGFETEDGAALAEAIGRPFTGPVSPAPGLCFYFTTDPDGYRIQLMEHKE